MTITIPTTIPIQNIPYVHKDYEEINHCINNLNDLIWNVSKGVNSWCTREDKFGFFISGLDISDNILSVFRIDGNLMNRDYALTFFDTSKSYYEVRTTKHLGYLELKIWNDPSISYVFTETKDSRDKNTDKEIEAAQFITQLCDMVRVVKAALPYSKKDNEII